MSTTNHRNKVKIKVVPTHLVFNINESRIRDRFRIDLQSLSSRKLLEHMRRNNNVEEKHTSRKSSRSLSSLAFCMAAQASSGSLSGMLFRSNLRFSLQSMVLWPLWPYVSLSRANNSRHCLTFHFAVLAHIRRSFRALSSRMAFLVADAASAFENTRLAAFCFAVTAVYLAIETHLIVMLLTLPHRSWSRPYPYGAQGSYVQNDHQFHSCTCISKWKRDP